MHRIIVSFKLALFLIFCGTFLPAKPLLPPSPDEGDADAFMESIGKKNSREFFDDFTNGASRNPIREDLGGGKLSSSFGTYDEAARGIAIQTNGKVVVVGRFNNASGSGSSDNFIIARYDVDGSVDASFGTAGKIIVDFSSMADVAHAVVIQTDGRIVAVGKADVGAQFYSDFAIARLTTTGALDTTFHTDGKVTTSVGPSQDVARAVVQDTTGRLVVAGYVWDRTNSDYDGLIVRYNSDGTLDTTFKTTGKLQQALSTGQDFLYGISLLSDGRLAVGGADLTSSTTYQTYTSGSGNWTVPVGGPYDITVELIGGGGGGGAGETGPGSGEWGGGGGGGGYVKHSVSSVASGTNIAYLVGTGGTGRALDSDLDGGNGTASTCTTYTLSAGGGGGGGAFNASSGVGGSAGVASGGNTTNTNGSAGTNEVGSGDGGAAAGPVGVAGAAQTVDGATGNNYGGGGASSDESPGDSGSGAGGWVRFGYAGGGTWDFLAGRYMSNGTLDTTFYTTGGRKISVLSSTDIAWGIALIGEQSVLVGEADNGSNADFAVMRLISNGTLDTAFRTVGYHTHTLGTGTDVAYAVKLQTDAKPIVGGYYYNGSNNDFALTRYETNGTFDTSFNTNGKKFDAIGAGGDYGVALGMLGDDYLVFGGRTTNAAGNLDIAYARYQTNGTLAQSGQPDFGFGTNGTLVQKYNPIALTGGLVEQTDGRLLVMGAGWNGVSSLDFMILRINPDGNLDTAFFTDGESVIGFDPSNTDVAFDGWIQTDGKIVVGGPEDSDDAVDENFAIARLSTSGELDTSFHTDGKLSWDVGGATAADANIGIKQDASGKTVLSGVSAQLGLVSRLETDGTLDTSFSTDGYDKSAFPGQASFSGMRFVFDTGGEIYLNGWGSNDGGTTAQPLIRKFLQNGTLDTAFHTDGSQQVAVVNIELPGIPSGMSRFSDGSLLFGGADSNLDFAVWKLRSDGTLDTSFHTSGTHSTDFFGDFDLVSNTVIQDNGKVVAGGTVVNGLNSDFGLARYNSDGQIDTSFSTDGKSFFDFGDAEAVYSLIQRKNGKLCLVGYQATNGTYYSALACYWP